MPLFSDGHHWEGRCGNGVDGDEHLHVVSRQFRSYISCYWAVWCGWTNPPRCPSRPFLMDIKRSSGGYGTSSFHTTPSLHLTDQRIVVVRGRLISSRSEEVITRRQWDCRHMLACVNLWQSYRITTSKQLWSNPMPNSPSRHFTLHEYQVVGGFATGKEKRIIPVTGLLSEIRVIVCCRV